jgi:hypothetical protein
MRAGSTLAVAHGETCGLWLHPASVFVGRIGTVLAQHHCSRRYSESQWPSIEMLTPVLAFINIALIPVQGNRLGRSLSVSKYRSSKPVLFDRGVDSSRRSSS